MQIEPWTLLWQAINLLVLLAILRWLLFKPLQNVIAERQHRVQEQTERAQVAEAAAEKRQAELDVAKNALEASRKAILQRASEEATQTLQAAKAQLLNDQGAAQAAMRQRLQDERHQAEQALLDHAAEVATEIAGDLLRQISTAQADEPFIESLLTVLEGSSDDERRAWQAPDAAPTVTLVSAHLLPETARVRWAQRLRDALGKDCTVQFSLDAALLAGAELRFAHGVLARHWAGQLAATRMRLLARTHQDAADQPAAGTAP